MAMIVLDESIRIPARVANLAAFRRWTRSDQFPERGWISYLNGEVWVDLSMERLEHNDLKGLFAVVVGGLVLAARLGRYIHDRMRLVNEEVGLSTEPDGMFVSRRALRSGRVRLEEGLNSVEVIGTPDMALEVVSPRSVQKDTVVLRDLYRRAGITEYWLVNPLGGQLSFQILRHTPKGYVPAASSAGWIKSAVFRRSFRLTQQDNGEGLPDYRLDVR
jgi:Uma2 family endonuclease